MIDPGDITSYGKKGDVICRETHWTDVAKFFLVNYALHALTVLTQPGSGVVITVCDCVRAILLPYTGTVKALIYIFDFAIKGENSLEQSKLADALCMIVPQELEFRFYLSTNLFNVHGQYPILSRRFGDRFKKAKEHVDTEDIDRFRFIDSFMLTPVPQTFKVRPILCGKQYENGIASNYSVLKTLAAITQIIYGSYELYKARGRQINSFGYAAYSLSVIPYVLMSFLNLVASICRPSYPSKYLVYYRGEDIPAQEDANYDSDDADSLMSEKIDDEDREDWMRVVESRVAGAVGYAYGNPDDQCLKITSTNSPAINLLLLIFLAIPYIIIYALTGFHNGESTQSQRAWIMCSLVLGQISTVTIQYLLPLFCYLLPIDFNITYVLFSILLSAPTIGAFVKVAQMILQDNACTRI